MSEHVVRLLTLEDLEIFHALRLRACREEPTAFMEAYEELVTQPLASFARYFDSGWIAGAFIQNELVGAAGLFRHKGLKVAHKATVWNVYVTPQMRRHGIARSCIKMVLQEAEKAGIELVQLTTTVDNPVTVSLYKSLGFEPWGVEKHALKLADGRYIHDVVMSKFLV